MKHDRIGAGTTLLATALLAACSGDMMGMSGMSGAGDMRNGMMELHRHMTMMEAVSADSMKALLPAHRQMAASMLSRTGADMPMMAMRTDVAFMALGDSLRQDMVRMPELDVAALAGFFPAHHARMMRYMKEHEAMTKP